MKKSKVITFIGGFYIFGGIISFLSLLLGGSPLNTVFALPDIPDYVVKFLLAIIYIPAGYLFLKRVKFSNWLILVLAVLTFCISAELTTTFNAQPYIGNMLYSLFVSIVTIIRRKEFTNNIKSTVWNSITSLNTPKSERERPSTLRDWPPCPPIQRGGGRRSRPGANPFISVLTVAHCPAIFRECGHYFGTLCPQVGA